LDDDGKLMACTTRAVLFCIQDGRCIPGPCAGANLRALKLWFTAVRFI
jgi:nitrite reductase/ring-hydroxylating ferredoxin subunit